ncbi:MAG TPA: class I SAM-dependent methyltransferase [Terriglobia bacterium]|nr:class I SAM-dependent methyltransferase [Terriglobia bacterium]
MEFPASRPRYGWERPLYEPFRRACEEKRLAFEERLTRFLEFTQKLLLIPKRSEDPINPGWENEMFPALDAIALYGMLCLERPRRYFEIGAGHSTRFARRAINDHGLQTSITCIDPAPGLPVEGVANRIISSSLEDVDLGLFDELDTGDILFVDGSHRALMNSDVTVVFLDILPMLKPGVLVHFHDIHLPYDYPPEWTHRYYNEQYLLAAYLLGGKRLDIVLANAFITRDERLYRILEPIWTAPAMSHAGRYGASLWTVTLKDAIHVAVPPRG